jgi:hypothetical protein
VFKSIIYLGLFVSVNSAALSAEVSFDEITRHPERFHRKRVTVRGLAEGGGDAIELWRDVRARTRNDLKRDHIYVRYPLDIGDPHSTIPPFGYAHLRFVKITGVIDTNAHGLSGTEPFTLFLKHLEVLPGPRQRQFLVILAEFRNDLPQEIKLKGQYINSGMSIETGTGPQGITEIAVPLTYGVEVVVEQSGKRLARYTVRHDPQSQQYYDAAKKLYYFRITNRGIHPVAPREGRSWSLGYTADRD